MNYFSDEEYSRILDDIVVACVDVLVCSPDGKVLLGKRNRLPLINWWLFGGRMQAHETLEQATARALKRELGISEFSFEGTIGSYLLDWELRHENPQQNGCTHLLLATKVVVEEEEVRNTYPDAHDEIRWFSANEIQTLVCDDNLKEVLRDAGILQPAHIVV